MSIRPLANPRAFEILGTPLFSDEECDAIIATADAAAAERGGWVSAAVYSDTDQSPRVELETRSVTSVALPGGGDDLWIAQKLVGGLAEVNDAVYRMDLVAIPPNDYPSVLRYDDGTADHFRAHRDSGGSSSTRRLTFSVQLSDPTTYSGCDLFFPSTGTVGPRERGTLITFPSSEFHHVTPIVSGRRYVILGWVHGPATA